MKSILSWGVIAILLYAGYTYGRPYIEDLLAQQSSGDGSTSSGSGDDSVCVRSARKATEDFASKASRFSAPVDQAEWQSALSMSRGRVQKARDICRCNEPACSTASQALDQLDGLMHLYDRMLGSNDSSFNPANRLEGVYDTLERAAAQTGG